MGPVQSLDRWGVDYIAGHMAKEKTIYTCNECGGTSPRWLGKCPHCNAWNTLIESVAESSAPAKNRFAALAKTAEVTTLADIEATDVQRTPTGHDELDRVLGGGIVEGGVVLIGGDPGIGKSTLLLQALDALQRAGQKTLYVTGEESGAQVALRDRLGVSILGLGNSVVDGDAPPRHARCGHLARLASLDDLESHRPELDGDLANDQQFQGCTRLCDEWPRVHGFRLQPQFYR